MIGPCNDVRLLLGIGVVPVYQADENLRGVGINCEREAVADHDSALALHSDVFTYATFVNATTGVVLLRNGGAVVGRPPQSFAAGQYTRSTVVVGGTGAGTEYNNLVTGNFRIADVQGLLGAIRAGKNAFRAPVAIATGCWANSASTWPPSTAIPPTRHGALLSGY